MIGKSVISWTSKKESTAWVRWNVPALISFKPDGAIWWVKESFAVRAGVGEEGGTATNIAWI